MVVFWCGSGEGWITIAACLQVCVQIKLCPPPSWHESLTMQAHNLYSKYNKYSLDLKVIEA